MCKNMKVLFKYYGNISVKIFLFKINSFNFSKIKLLLIGCLPNNTFITSEMKTSLLLRIKSDELSAICKSIGNLFAKN